MFLTVRLGPMLMMTGGSFCWPVELLWRVQGSQKSCAVSVCHARYQRVCVRDHVVGKKMFWIAESIGPNEAKGIEGWDITSPCIEKRFFFFFFFFFFFGILDKNFFF